MTLTWTPSAELGAEKQHERAERIAAIRMRYVDRTRIAKALSQRLNST